MLSYINNEDKLCLNYVHGFFVKMFFTTNNNSILNSPMAFMHLSKAAQDLHNTSDQ